MKDANTVPDYLRRHGCEITPLNPFADKILGLRCYESLSDIPSEMTKRMEVLDISRPFEDVAAVVDQAVELKTVHRNLKAV